MDEWTGQHDEPAEWQRVIKELEEFAESRGIQVLSTEDIRKIDGTQPPWVGNIVIDDQYMIMVPNDLPEHPAEARARRIASALLLISFSTITVYCGLSLVLMIVRLFS